MNEEQYEYQPNTHMKEAMMEMENRYSSYMMPRMVPIHKFLPLVFVLMLSCLGFEMTWMINTASVDSKQEVVQVKNTLVFDVGMNNGDDTSLLLELGYNVVAVEANPVLVDAARKRFASEINEGRLSIAHVALPLGKSKAEADQAGVKFYISKRRDVWSSFDASVGCRGECWQDTECSGTNPKPCCRGPENCDAVEVKTVSCLDIMNMYGTPYIMKLDVEGAETTCIDAVQSLENKPRIVTLERKPDRGLFDKMKLAGFTQFKLVEQGGALDQLGIVSGPLGALALDCKRGYLWHETSDHTPEYEKELVEHCTKNGDPSAWFDWHFRHPGGNAAGLRGAFTQVKSRGGWQ